jgi:hypothetical protein
LLLRPEQRRVFSEIKSTFIFFARKLIFRAPTDWGKTPVFLALAEERHPATIIEPTYEAVNSVIDTIKAMGLDKKFKIVIPEGRERIRKRICGNKNCKNCKLKREISLSLFVGITNAERINAKEVCPYLTLKRLSEEADLVITSHAFITNSDYKGRGLLIIDEVDKLLEPTEFLLAAYELGGGLHLESTTKQPLSRLINIFQNIKCPYPNPADKEAFDFRIKGILSTLEIFKELLLKNPIYFEERNIEERQCGIKYGLMTASAKVREEVTNLNNILQKVKLNLDLPPGDLASLNFDDERLVLSFLAVMKNFKEIAIRDALSSPTYGGKGYLEIYIFSNINHDKIFKNYNRVLFVTATPPLLNIPIIEATDDPNGDKKMVIYIPETELGKLISKLDEYKTLIITTSKRRMYEAIKNFGGTYLNLKNLEPGAIQHDFIASETSRGVNNLGAFDIAIVTNWIPRKPYYEVDNKTELKWYSAKNLYQHISRIFRTQNGYHRKRAAIITDLNAFNSLKQIVPNWLYYEVKDVNEAISLIKSHVELEREPVKEINFPIEVEAKEIRVGKHRKVCIERIYLPKKYANKKFKIEIL